MNTTIHPDVKSLLTVQQDDLHIFELEAKLASLAPRLAALEHERSRAAEAVERERRAIEAEEARQREAKTRIETHKQLSERSQRQYESVTTPREATAAMAQLEQTRRMVTESERDAEAIHARIEQMRALVTAQQQALEQIEHTQAEARSSLDADRAVIESELAAAKAKRSEHARAVPRPMLGAYDRIQRRRHAATVFPLRGPSCGSCDTAVPTQRRASMASTGSLEMCEGCGALLYAGE